MMKKSIKIVLLVSIIAACDVLDTDIPSDEIPDEIAFQTEADLQDLLNSSYDVLANYKNGLSQRLAALLSNNIADNFTDAAGFFREVYTRNTNIFNEEVQAYYQEPYFAIHRANLVIENVDLVDMSEASRNQMIAESRFLRGLSHFDVANLMAHPPGFTSDNSHQGIPLRLETGADPVNRSTVAESYESIIRDLRFAAENLPTNNGIYATSYAAEGMLAKVYFMLQNYDSAIYFVNQVLEPGNPFRLTNDVNARYSQNITSEHIFYTISTGNNDNRANVFTGAYRSDVNEPFLKITQDLHDLGTSSAADDRAEWFEMRTREDGSNFYVSTKYNLTFLNVAIVHVVDMLLTRAEAYAINNDLSNAIADINTVRTRAGVAGISPVSSQAQVLQAVRNERRIELSLEGDWVFQLKRRGASGEDIQIRGSEWDCPGMVLQFPNEETFPSFVNNESGGC